MAHGSCKFCGNAYEECSCDFENGRVNVTSKSNQYIKDIFKNQLPRNIQVFVDIAKLEYEKELGRKIDLNDPKLPQYQRSAVMANAMAKFLANK